MRPHGISPILGTLAAIPIYSERANGRLVQMTLAGRVLVDGEDKGHIDDFRFLEGVQFATKGDDGKAGA